MPMAYELERGFHIATSTSKVTPTHKGIFLPYDGYWGKRMQALKEFVITYYDEPQKKFPSLFEDHIPQEEAVRQCLYQRERLIGSEELPSE